MFAYASEGNSARLPGRPIDFQIEWTGKLGAIARLFAECLLEFAISAWPSWFRCRSGEVVRLGRHHAH